MEVPLEVGEAWRSSLALGSAPGVPEWICGAGVAEGGRGCRMGGVLVPSVSSGLKQENPESPQISEEPEEHDIKLEEDLLQITVGVKAEEHSLLQEIPQSPQTKEEPEEVRIKHEEEPLPVCVKTEEWSLPQRQSEHREETQGEDISPESEGHTEHSSDHDQDEDLHLQPVSSETDDDGDDHHRP
uniref:Uncharacterized protein n=1 Tax=Knipowitschia caucasica TaxID=637954 RepID=A0AAV2MDT9_KNICA